MGGALPPLLQYAFMAWCSVRGSTETTLLLPLRVLKICVRDSFFQIESQRKLKGNRGVGEI
jgi:hypothetical protein